MCTLPLHGNVHHSSVGQCYFAEGGGEMKRKQGKARCYVMSIQTDQSFAEAALMTIGIPRVFL